MYYIELLNENPDCTETMSLVAEDLLGWVVLVGDGKTNTLSTLKNNTASTTKASNLPRRLAYSKKLSANPDESILCCWSEGDSQKFRLSWEYVKVCRAIL